MTIALAIGAAFIDTEEWRPIPGYPLYEVSDMGNVRSLTTWKHGQLMRPVLRNGYPAVRLYVSPEVRHTRPVHRLVMLAFVGPIPMDMETRHLDGDRANPKLANLAYGTRSENMRDKERHGTNFSRNKTHCLRGHPFDETNTRFGRKGNRECRACKRERDRARRAA